MKILNLALAAGFVAVTLLSAPAVAATRVLKNQPEQAEPLEQGPVVAMKQGKVVARYPAPDRRTELYVHDEGEVGDFVWHAIYVRAAGKFQLLGSCQEVKKVAWSKDSKTVTFQLIKATGPETSTTFAARYRVGERKIALKALTETDVQSSM